MSIKDDLTELVTRTNGSFKTISDRKNMVKRFVNSLKENNIQIRGIDHLKTKHLEQYIASRKDGGISLRSLQNEMSNIRVILREANRSTIANSERLSNKSLGINGASRDGTHLAMPSGRFQALTMRLESVDKDVLACVQLERHLGLRGEEAVSSYKSLASWEKQLQKGNAIRVIYGTKGGRSRDTRAVNIEKALSAIKYAIERTKVNSGRIINKPDLKSAMHRHAYILRSNGCTGEYSPHSLRYAFAVDRVDKYESQGFSREESLAMTSMDLGHGDGRGRYIAQVYLKK